MKKNISMKVLRMARLKTSKKTKETLKSLQNRLNLRPNVLSRYSINLSIKAIKTGEILPEKEYDNDGLEFRKETLFGDYELIFKTLMTQVLNKKISKDEFYPHYTKLFLEHGVKLLENEYEFAGNYETFLLNIINNKMG